MDFLDVKDDKALQKLKKHYEDGMNVFVLIYMNGCGPCEETKPEWLNLKNKKWDNTIVAQIDKDILPERGVFSLEKISGFPTIRHFSKGKEEDYNDKRNSQLFEKWINSQLGKTIVDKTLPSVHTGHFIRRSKRRSRKSRRLRSKRSRRIKN
jgi:thiol-disulfide isomerase/thioredoxin